MPSWSRVQRRVSVLRRTSSRPHAAHRRRSWGLGGTASKQAHGIFPVRALPDDLDLVARPARTTVRKVALLDPGVGCLRATVVQRRRWCTPVGLEHVAVTAPGARAAAARHRTAELIEDAGDVAETSGAQEEAGDGRQQQEGPFTCVAHGWCHSKPGANARRRARISSSVQPASQLSSLPCVAFGPGAPLPTLADNLPSIW